MLMHNIFGVLSINALGSKATFQPWNVYLLSITLHEAEFMNLESIYLSPNPVSTGFFYIMAAQPLQ